MWADLEKTLRFWLDRGVDGFRVHVAHGMRKPDGLPDHPGGDAGATVGLPAELDGDPRFDHDGVHDVHRMIRAVLDHFPGRMAIGEITVSDDERFARSVRSDELHLGFNVRLLRAAFRRARRAGGRRALARRGGAGGRPTELDAVEPPCAPSGQPLRRGGRSAGRGRGRGRWSSSQLPGVVHLYNGEELGLPDAELQDRIWDRSGHTERGRDSCRVPMPWEGDAPGYGFTSGQPWLPMPLEYGELTVAGQLEDTSSMLSLIRRSVELRTSHPAFGGDGVEWFGAPSGCLAFGRAGSTLVCALNASTDVVALPPGDVLLASGLLEGDLLPPDTAARLA